MCYLIIFLVTCATVYFVTVVVLAGDDAVSLNDYVTAAHYLIILLIVICIIYVIYRVIKRESMHSQKCCYMDILRNGRKSLATVQKVEFIGSRNIIDYYIHDYDPFGADIGWGYCAAYDMYYPVMRITYKFNPPDDSSDKDLIHSIVVPADSEKFIKPGDLLPILYTIDEKDNSMVNSMPFPMPMREFMNLDEMMFIHSNHLKEVNYSWTDDE